MSWSELPWIGRLREYREAWRAEMAARAEVGSGPLHAAAFYLELRKHLAAETVISWDGGDFVQWGRVSMPATRPGEMAAVGAAR